jgi:Protein of unknown function (DUF3102)
MTIMTSITAERTQWAARISAAWQQSVTSIIGTGRLLTEAKAALDHGEWLPMIESDLPFGPRTAQMLMKIAEDKRITNTKHVSLLPPSWGALYEITKLTDEAFERKVEDGTINPEMQRKDVARENRIRRERDRRRVEILAPIRGTTKRGKKISVVPASSTCYPEDPKMSNGTEEIELGQVIARLRRDQPSNADTMLICDALERRLKRP